MALHFPFKRALSDSSSLQGKTDSDYEFVTAINLFIAQQKKLGISLEELSKKTKISRNVLIAIKNGQKKYIPEKTYLISMLKMIEIELDLEKGSLNGLLVQENTNNDLSKFQFINIDFLNNWIGSILYFIFMLLCILAINSQQKYLLKINTLSTEPVIIIEADKEIEYTLESKD
tara:strand:+ start:294 stop:815 length:522 start_codon:yes stop_codon:yes gene_type:complete